MIREISHFRVYAALSYSTNQLDSMQWSLRGIFPHNEMGDLCELSKQPINNDWRKKTEAVVRDNTRIKIKNVIQDIRLRRLRGIQFTYMRDLRK